MSYEASVTIEKGDMEKLQQALTLIKEHAIYAGRATVSIMAENFAKDVKKRYAAGVGPQMARSTLERRLQGKRAGKTPAIAAYPGTKPLSRSGTLMRLVSINQRDSKRTMSRTVYIKPGIRIPGGGLSSRVAAIHEAGAVISFLAPRRVRIYLMALALGIAGTSTQVPTEFMPSAEPIQITMRLPARPVWAPAFMAVLAAQPFGPKGFAQIFAQELRKKTGLPITFTVR